MAGLALCPVSVRPSRLSARVHASRQTLRRQSAHLRRRQVVRAADEGEPIEAEASSAPKLSPPPPPTPSGLYTGYIKTDAAGISVIDVVEPTVYVSGTRPDDETAKSSTTLAYVGGALALAGAAAILTFLSGSPAPVTSGPTLSQLVQKFELEIEAAAPSLTITVEAPPAAAPAVVIEVEEASPEEDAVIVEAVLEAVPEVDEAVEETVAVEVAEPVQVSEIVATAEVEE